MKIYGIPATNAHKLSPDQWVNVWKFNYWSKLEFYTDCRVKDLEQFVDFDEHEIDDFVLEPTTDAGEPVSVKGTAEYTKQWENTP
jgi:hypothetical protein